MIVEMDLYAQIRTLYNEGFSQRNIAHRLGISRQTVKKYCEGNTHPDERKPYHRESEVLTQDVLDFIRSCLEEDRKENLHKQGHTAKRIYNRLVFEKGFQGAESTVRNAVKSLRSEVSVPPQADIPLEYDPGDAIQIDWGEATAYLNGVKTKLYFFCGRLCYSCAIVVQAFYSQNQESFLEAQQKMFDFFGGVPIDSYSITQRLQLKRVLVLMPRQLMVINHLQHTMHLKQTFVTLLAATKKA